MMIEDHGRIDDLETYCRSDRYRHRIFGMKLNTLFKIIGRGVEARSKAYLDNLREQYSEN
jgi:hypothetical protein